MNYIMGESFSFFSVYVYLYCVGAVMRLDNVQQQQKQHMYLISADVTHYIDNSVRTIRANTTIVNTC